MLRQLIAALVATCVLGTLAGCNTIAGAGKDIERGGEAIQDTARGVQKKM